MKLHPPDITDWSIVTRMGRIGIVPARASTSKRSTRRPRRSWNRARPRPAKRCRSRPRSWPRWSTAGRCPIETMGVYGNHYLKRATLAMVGLGSNPPEDAIYPLAFVDADGNPLTGDHGYVLHFDQQELSPVNASGRSPSTIGTASRSQIRSTATPSVTATPCTTTPTARWISSSGTRTPDPSMRRTGFLPQRARWPCSCASTNRSRRCWTDGGSLPECGR
jgi:hypothetical protein